MDVVLVNPVRLRDKINNLDINPYID